MMASLSGTLATMGPGVPYAIAAKFCHPDRPSIAMVGDGAMQMNGNAELVTAAKYWKQWSDPRLIICVLNNHDLNQVTWEQRVMEGDPMYPGTQEIPEFPYARYAELIGFTGIRVDDPNDLGAPGIKRSRRIDRSCSRRLPIPRSRRCRRTSRSSRPSSSPAR
jgi:pyruvate dehydrogenase (quinone)